MGKVTVVAVDNGPVEHGLADATVAEQLVEAEERHADLLRQIVNENGSDGTVRVCAANLNASGVTIDFRETAPEKLFKVWESRLECEVPLAVLPTRTHGSIVDPERADKDNQESIVETADQKRVLGDLILEETEQSVVRKSFDEAVEGVEKKPLPYGRSTSGPEPHDGGRKRLESSVCPRRAPTDVSSGRLGISIRQPSSSVRWRCRTLSLYRAIRSSTRSTDPFGWKLRATSSMSPR